MARARSDHRVAVALVLASFVLASLLWPTPGTGESAERGTPFCFEQAVTITGSGYVEGTAGSDVILTGPGRDTVRAGPGDDRICTRGGDDLAIGGAGDDQIHGGTGHDMLVGDAANFAAGPARGGGDDFIEGGDGSDEIVGDAATEAAVAVSTGGNDVLIGGAGKGGGGYSGDYIIGGSAGFLGQQRGTDGMDLIHGGPEHDVLVGDNGRFGDQRSGRGGGSTDFLLGEGGPDRLFGGPKRDGCVGGRGRDSAEECERVESVPRAPRPQREVKEAKRSPLPGGKMRRPRQSHRCRLTEAAGYRAHHIRADSSLKCRPARFAIRKYLRRGLDPVADFHAAGQFWICTRGIPRHHSGFCNAKEGPVTFGFRRIIRCSATDTCAGDIDRSFGTNGKLFSKIEGAGGSQHNGFALDRRGRIYVLGQLRGHEGLIRLHRDGSIDRTWGGEGDGVRSAYSFDQEFIGAVQHQIGFQPDGTLITACELRLAPGNRTCIWLADPDSDDLGRVVTVGSWSSSESRAPRDLAIGPDGEMAVLAESGSEEHPRVTLFRFRPNGTLDYRFGKRGRRSLRRLPAQSVEFDRRGGLLLSTFTELIRLRRDGSRDHRFGDHGMFRGWFPLLAVDRKGRILLSGSKADLTGAGVVEKGTFRVVRLRPDGTRDRSFSEDGVRRLRHIRGSYSVGSDLVTRASRVLLGIGGSRPGDGYRVVALNSRGGLSKSFGNHGWVHTRFPGKITLAGLAAGPGGRLLAASVVEQRRAIQLRMAAYRLRPSFPSQ